MWNESRPSRLRAARGMRAVKQRRYPASGMNAGNPHLFPALSVIAVSQDAALACSCARCPTAEGTLGQSAAVFTGKVQNSVLTGPARSIIALRFIEAFKGTSSGAVLTIVHGRDPSASCAVKFAPGAVCTLAAYRDRSASHQSTSLCSLSMFNPGVVLGEQLIERMRAHQLTTSGGSKSMAEPRSGTSPAQGFGPLQDLDKLE